MSNDEIVQELVISPLTAKTHVGRAMTKLGVRDRAQLVVLALRTGLTRLEDLSRGRAAAVVCSTLASSITSRRPAPNGSVGRSPATPDGAPLPGSASRHGPVTLPFPWAQPPHLRVARTGVIERAPNIADVHQLGVPLEPTVRVDEQCPDLYHRFVRSERLADLSHVMNADLVSANLG